jgi:hypothetical protein
MICSNFEDGNSSTTNSPVNHQPRSSNSWDTNITYSPRSWDANSSQPVRSGWTEPATVKRQKKGAHFGHQVTWPIHYPKPCTHLTFRQHRPLISPGQCSGRNGAAALKRMDRFRIALSLAVLYYACTDAHHVAGWRSPPLSARPAARRHHPPAAMHRLNRAARHRGLRSSGRAGVSAVRRIPPTGSCAARPDY